MSDLLVTILMSACPISVYGGTTKCQEYLVNCAVGHKGEITADSIRKCLEKYQKESHDESSDSGE